MRHARIEGVIEMVNLDYMGSITIPEKLMDDKDILENEQVHVLNKSNGQRFITYAIPGDGIYLNGAAARLGVPGDKVIILTYHIV